MRKFIHFNQFFLSLSDVSSASYDSI